MYIYISTDEILTKHAKELSADDEEVHPVTKSFLLRHCGNNLYACSLG